MGFDCSAFRVDTYTAKPAKIQAVQWVSNYDGYVSAALDKIRTLIGPENVQETSLTGLQIFLGKEGWATVHHGWWVSKDKERVGLWADEAFRAHWARQ